LAGSEKSPFGTVIPAFGDTPATASSADATPSSAQTASAETRTPERTARRKDAATAALVAKSPRRGSHVCMSLPSYLSGGVSKTFDDTDRDRIWRASLLRGNVT